MRLSRSLSALETSGLRSLLVKFLFSLHSIRLLVSSSLANTGTIPARTLDGLIIEVIKIIRFFHLK